MKEIKKLLREILAAVKERHEHRAEAIETATYISQDGEIMRRNPDGSYRSLLHLHGGFPNYRDEAKRITHLLNTHK